MKNITIDDVKNLKEHDRISITYKNTAGGISTKNTRFYGIEENLILVYMPKKQKRLWEVPIGCECEIKKI